MQEIAFDPKFAARLMARLGDDGLPVVEHPQSSLHFTEGITEFQRAVIGPGLRHGGHPVLRWCVANVAPVTTDTGLVRFSKNRSADAIDCAVAAAMAIGRAPRAAAARSTTTKRRGRKGCCSCELLFGALTNFTPLSLCASPIILDMHRNERRTYFAIPGRIVKVEGI